MHFSFKHFLPPSEYFIFRLHSFLTIAFLFLLLSIYHTFSIQPYQSLSVLQSQLNESGVQVELLINCAGCGYLDDFDEAALDTQLRMVDLNVRALTAVTRIVLDHMPAGGRIINISSVSGVMGNAGQANYSASKAGVIGLTKSVARELAGRGVTCNAVAPGFIETEMTEAMTARAKEAVMAQIPMGRTGTVEDVAELVSFLASDRSAYITGQVISVDGGMHM